MQRTTDSHDDLNTAPPLSQENREKIEAVVSSQVLTKQVEEFFRVQRDFHKAMQSFVSILSESQLKENEINGIPVDKLLAPYQVLIDNPFHASQSGDVVSDILYIINVINKQNKAFHHELNALNKCIIHKDKMSHLLVYFKDKPEMSEKIQQQLGVSSWMMVEGQADKPFQLLTRYELLLKAIHKTLLDSHCDHIESTLHGLMSSVEYLVPEVSKINENLSTILELNKLEYILTAMLSLDKVKNAATIPNTTDTPLPQKITFVLDCIKTAKNNILENHQENQILYKVLVELLTEINLAYKALPWTGIRSYLTRESMYKGYSALYGTFFGWPEDGTNNSLDPGVELDAIIEKFKTTAEQIEALRNIIDSHTRNLF